MIGHSGDGVKPVNYTDARWIDHTSCKFCQRIQQYVLGHSFKARVQPEAEDNSPEEEERVLKRKSAKKSRAYFDVGKFLSDVIDSSSSDKSNRDGSTDSSTN